MNDSGTKKSKKTSSKEDLKQAIQKRIEGLTKELEQTAQKKSQYQKAIRDLDTRMAQIVGALDELSRLLGSQDAT